MTQLTALLARLLRYLSSIVGASIKRVLALFNFIRWRISITKKSKSTLRDDPPPRSINLRSNDDGVVCPSYVPRAGHITLDVPNHHDHHDHDGPYTTTIVSPTPTKGFFSGNLYASSQASHSSRNIGSERGSDSRSVNSRLSVARQLNSAAASATSLLPISTHGLQIISARPDSRNSQRSSSPCPPRPISSNSNRSSVQPIKVSRTPTPAYTHAPSAHTADPSGEIPSRSSSPGIARMVLPMSTSTVQRWNRNVIVSTEFSHCLVDPFKFTYKDPELPAGWAPFTHPEGALYFFHAEKRIYTDANLYDPKNFAIISETGDQLLGRLEQEALDPEVAAVLPQEGYDLVMELVDIGREDLVVGYYFADHKSRLLFWLDEFDAARICNDIVAVVSTSHLRYEIESQYWTHYELYPNSRDFTQGLLDEVTGILLHAAADTVTSRTSTALWTTKQNKTMLFIVKKLNVNSKADHSWAGCVIGRLMRNLTHTQFIHLYGQIGARLNRDQSLHGTIVHPHTWHFKVMEPFLFWGAEVHLKALERIWVDRTVHIEPWKHFIDKLNTEWQDFILIGTVLLNANISFLSIQSIDNNGNLVAKRSLTQIVSYISMVTSLGSVLLAMLLVRQNRSKGREAADKAADFLANMTHSTRGLEHLSILYALPYALLMWSTLTFIASFAIEIFSVSTAATRVPVGSILVVCSLLVLWCILAAWICESNEPHMIEEFKQRMRKRVPQVIHTLLRMGAAAPEEKGGGEQAVDEKRKESDDTVEVTVCESSAEKPEQARKRSMSWQFFVRRATVDRSSEQEISVEQV